MGSEQASLSCERDVAALQAVLPETALAQFAAAVWWDELLPEVQDKARACLLYGLAVGIASRADTIPNRVLSEFGHSGSSSGSFVSGSKLTESATRLLDARQVGVTEAAFHNAILLHTRIQEDAHPAGHVGVVVVPAALAVGQSVGATGKELLSAIAVGYEVSLRIARDHVLDSSRRGFRSTSLYGVFGAAAAAARLMGYDAHGIGRAMSLASNLSGGLRGFVLAGSDEYVLHAAFAASNGINAAMLAGTSLQIAQRFLDCPAGFYPATGESGVSYSKRLTDRLFEDYEFLRITYKPFPGCQFNRDVIRGVLCLRQQCQVEHFKRMEIRMRPFEANFFGVGSQGPFQSYAQTFMSAPFCAAVAWLRNGVSYADLHRFDQAEFNAIAGRIQVIADDACAPYRPRIALFDEQGCFAQWHADDEPEDFLLDWVAASHMAGNLADQNPAQRQTLLAVAKAVGELDQMESLSALTSALCIEAEQTRP